MLRFIGVQSFFPSEAAKTSSQKHAARSVGLAEETGAVLSTSRNGVVDSGYLDPELVRKPTGTMAAEENGEEFHMLRSNERADAEPGQKDDERGEERKSGSSSSRIMGRFQWLKTLRHPNIVRYLEVMKGRRDVIVVIDARHSQLALSSLVDAAKDHGLLGTEKWESVCLGMFREVACALEHLHTRGIVHRCVRPDVVLVGDNGHLALADCGLFHMSGQGADVSFAIGSAAYSAPEVVLAPAHNNTSDRGTWTDIWSLGAVLFFALRGCLPWSSSLLPARIHDTVLALLAFSGFLPHLSEDLVRCEQTLEFSRTFFGGIDEDVSLEAARIVHLCLDPSYLRRPSASSLLANPYWHHIYLGAARARQQRSAVLTEVMGTEVSEASDEVEAWLSSEDDTAAKAASSDRWEESPAVRVVAAGVPTLDGFGQVSSQEKMSFGARGMDGFGAAAVLDGLEVDNTSVRPAAAAAGSEVDAEHERLYELLCYWVAVGGDYQSHTTAGLSHLAHPPILRVPLMGVAGVDCDDDKCSAHPAAFDDAWSTVSVESMQHTLGLASHAPAATSAPDRPGERRSHEGVGRQGSNRAPSTDAHTVQFGHTVVDAGRMTAANAREELEMSQTLRELLAERPVSRQQLLGMARRGVPAAVRGRVWREVLQVREEEVRASYSPQLRQACSAQVLKQIDKDAPRCHQYNPLLGSSEGQAKLRRVLAAWAAFNPHKNYWQGVDALAAPLLLHNFNDEALAFGCLHRLVEEHLPHLFAADSRQVAALNGMLGEFQRLLAFLDPELFSHLRALDLSPDLYCIPWFLTWFSHVLPLASLYKLWDRLLVGPPKLPVFFAVSVLMQIRDWLLNEELDGCFSRLTQTASNSLLPSDDALRECIDAADATCHRTPQSILAANCVGLHQRETTPAEIIPSLSLQDCVDLLAASAVSIIDTSPADLFRRTPRQQRFNVPGGILDAAPNLQAGLDALRGSVFAVTGPDDMCCRRLAEQLLVDYQLPCVCLLSWDELETITWKTQPTADDTDAAPDQGGATTGNGSADASREGLGRLGASVGMRLRGVGSLAGGAGLQWRPRTWLGLKSKDEDVDERAEAGNAGVWHADQASKAALGEDRQQELWAGGLGLESGQDDADMQNPKAVAAGGGGAHGEVDEDGLGVADDAGAWRADGGRAGAGGLAGEWGDDSDVDGGGCGGKRGSVDVVAEGRGEADACSVSSWDFSDDDGASKSTREIEHAGASAWDRAGGDGGGGGGERRGGRRMASDGDLEKVAEEDELGGWGRERHAPARKITSESDLEQATPSTRGSGRAGGLVGAGQDGIAALRRGVRIQWGLGGSEGLKAISGSVLSATKATVDRGASLGKKLLDALPDD